MSWLTDRKRKAEAKRRINNDPALRRMLVTKHIEAVTTATIKAADDKLAPILQCMCNALSNIFCRCVLSGWFKVSDDQVEEFFRKYTDRCESIDIHDKNPKLDVGTTTQAIITNEIRSKALYNAPTIGWRAYKPVELDVSAYAKKVPIVGDTDDAIATRSRRLWAAGYGNYWFDKAEVLFLSTLNDLWQWDKTKCEFFTLLLRQFRYISSKDVYWFIDWLESKGHIRYKDSDMRWFKRHEWLWQDALIVR